MVAKSIVVDRKYYLKSLRTPLINMFMPIVAQKFENSGAKAAAETERLLFDATKQRPWRFDAALKKASIDKSPLALAFSKCKKRPAEAPAAVEAAAAVVAAVAVVAKKRK